MIFIQYLFLNIVNALIEKRLISEMFFLIVF